MNLEHSLTRNYLFARASLEAGYTIYSIGKPTIIIYQMGKVGSTTILQSLKKCFPHSPIYHVHVLSKEGIKRAEKYYFGQKPYIFKRSRLPETIAVFQGYHLKHRLNHHKSKWKVVSLVRDPIARNISAFFEELGSQMPDMSAQFQSGLLTIEDIKAAFLEENSFHDAPLTWFDLELKRTLGIDVFSCDFPKSKGYKIYEGNFADLLVLRTSHINSVASIAFEEFLGLKNLGLVNSNETSQRSYSLVYQKFLDSIEVPQDYIHKMYSSKLMKHFFDLEEIEVLTKRWATKN